MNRSIGMGTVPICLSILVAGAWLTRAGSLTPPAGPIVSTMKDLDTVEPRTPIRAADLPMTISSPGSYYLAEDIATAGDGITIDADDVTLDLMGFSLAGGTDDGIDVLGAQTSITIRNGTVSGWAGFGVDAFSSRNIQLENLRASGNGATGLRIGLGGTVMNCAANGNTIDGIRTGDGCTIVNCTATSNSRSGIVVGFGCTIRSCTTDQNGDAGIDASDRCTVISCTADSNGGGAAALSKDGIKVSSGSSVIDCTAGTNRNSGIRVPAGSTSCTVRGCTAQLNFEDGIEASTDCHIVGNSCMNNGLVNGAGIHIIGDDNRIEGNTVTDNDRGIDVDAADNIIIRNTASGNTTNYDIVANNKVGVIVAAPNSGAISGSTGGAGVGTTDPWANFSF